MKPVMIPKEFRIFAKGWNPGSKGRALFDAKAAAQVMADYTRSGVDVMIDLEHLSLDEESKAYDPDARGWCKLELRNGELWAVDVRWTPDGLNRLRNRTQRYISPTFWEMKTSGRVAALVNIALCARPATYDIAPLVAASKRLIAASKFGSSRKLGLVSLVLNSKGVPMELSDLLKLLGLPEDGTLDDVAAAIQALQDKCAEMMGNGGDGDGDEGATAASDDDDKPPSDKATEEEKKAYARKQARAALADARNGQVLAEIRKLSKRLDDADKRADGDERDRLIKANSRKFNVKLEKKARGWPLSVLKEFIADAPDIGEANEDPPQHDGETAVTRSKRETEEVKLTDLDLKICKQTGRDPVKLLEFKKSQAASGRKVS